MSLPRKELSSELREQIIGAYHVESNASVIVSTLAIPKQTVRDTINRFKKTGSPHPVKRTGRPKNLSERDQRSLKRIVKKDRKASLIKITNQPNAYINNSIHFNNFNTTRNYIKLLSFELYYASHKPLLTTQHKKKCLQWCKERKTGMMNGTKLYGQMSHSFPFPFRWAYKSVAKIL